MDDPRQSLGHARTGQFTQSDDKQDGDYVQLHWPFLMLFERVALSASDTTPHIDTHVDTYVDTLWHMPTHFDTWTGCTIQPMRIAAATGQEAACCCLVGNWFTGRMPDNLPPSAHYGPVQQSPLRALSACFLFDFRRNPDSPAPGALLEFQLPIANCGR